MYTYVALLRGINVGGKNSLPMKDLIALMNAMGLRNAKTYIQSGNAVFQSSEKNCESLAGQMSAAIHKKHGMAPQVMLMTVNQYKKIIAANPFPGAEATPNALHVSFLLAAPKSPDLKALDAIKGEREEFRLKGSAFYLHAPDGIGRSKLATRVEKALGVAATSRNWRSVCKIAELAKELG